MSTQTLPTRREQLLARLGEEAEALRSSTGWQQWLAFASKFRTYSVPNQLLIAAQHPTATHVAGYRAWQGLGRQVTKGAQGIAILAPLPRRIVDEDTEEVRRVLSGFKIVYVFDVSQTEGRDLPTLTMPPVRVPDLALRDQLIDAVRRAGLGFVMETSGPPDVRGWYEPARRTISLVTSYPVSEQVRTLLHELAHAFDPVVGQPGSVRAERELVAESVAYLLGIELGLTIEAASTHYVTSWGADKVSMTRLATQALKIASSIDRLLIVT